MHKDNFKFKQDNNHKVRAYLSGKMRKYYIRILLGDRVRVELSEYDVNLGRITYRYKSKRGGAVGEGEGKEIGGRLAPHNLTLEKGPYGLSRGCNTWRFLVAGGVFS